MKKIISVILASVMMAGLCACGKAGSGRVEGETTEAEIETVATTAAATVETSMETTATEKPAETTEGQKVLTCITDTIMAHPGIQKICLPKRLQISFIRSLPICLRMACPVRNIRRLL